MTFLARLLMAAAITAALSGAAGPAVADDAENEALYQRYHRAIEAAKQCRRLDFDQEAHFRMADVINERIQHSIGAKRLPLLTAAQREARALVERYGCKSEQVGELLALFDAELAPALK